MDLEEVKKAHRKALDEYNYDELYAMHPAEVVAMAVTRKRFGVFMEMLIEGVKKNGGQHVPMEFYQVAAALTVSAAVVHLEEIIRVPVPQPEVAFVHADDEEPR